MVMVEILKGTLAGIVVTLFWLMAGIFCSPGWALIVLVGCMLKAFEWNEFFTIWGEMIMLEWFFNTAEDQFGN